MAKISVKSPAELKIMADGGEIAARIREELVQMAQPGRTTLELNELAAGRMEQLGVQASFKGFSGYPYHIITCLNEEVVHGLPSKRKLKTGDLLTIDLGVLHRGFHTDTATTIEVTQAESLQQNAKFLRVGQLALARAIQQARPGASLRNLSREMQKTIEAAGYNVIRAFVGHGIGKSLHEFPQIPCYTTANPGPVLQEGNTLAVEVMYTQGSYEVEILADGWTVITRDGSLAAMFEHTIAVSKPTAKILTDSDTKRIQRTVLRKT